MWYNKNSPTIDTSINSVPKSEIFDMLYGSFIFEKLETENLKE